MTYLSRSARRQATGRALGSIPPTFWYSLMLLVGILMIVFGLFQAFEWSQSNSWVTVPGKIIESRVNTITSIAENSQGEKYEVYQYVPLVRYEYTVNGQRFVSEKVRLSEEMCLFSYCASDIRPEYTTDKAQTYISKYPQNMAVTVFYDPADPATAVIERNVSPFVYFAFGFGLLMVLLGGALFWSATGKKPEPQPYFAMKGGGGRR